MANFSYPKKYHLEKFIEVIKEQKFKILRYLPPISEDWYRVVSDCIQYVENTSHYHSSLKLENAAAHLLYKVAKRHELGDGNKRSAVIAVFLFCILNDRYILDPQKLKVQAKRAAKTKGRKNEEIIKERIAVKLLEIMEPLNERK